MRVSGPTLKLRSKENIYSEYKRSENLFTRVCLLFTFLREFDIITFKGLDIIIGYNNGEWLNDKQLYHDIIRR